MGPRWKSSNLHENYRQLIIYTSTLLWVRFSSISNSSKTKAGTNYSEILKRVNNIKTLRCFVKIQPQYMYWLLKLYISIKFDGYNWKYQPRSPKDWVIKWCIMGITSIIKIIREHWTINARTTFQNQSKNISNVGAQTVMGLPCCLTDRPPIRATKIPPKTSWLCG